MSDPIPRDGEIETGAPDDEGVEQNARRLPPEDLPEELVRRKLERLDTRRTLANLCKIVPGLDEVLLPRGIQADALTRKSGGSAQMLRGLSRRILQYEAAWGAFRTAVAEQIPPETYEALQDFSRDNLGALAEAHTTEGLLLAALVGEQEADPDTVAALLEQWREENQKAQKRASEDAHTRELEERLEKLKRENERLSFSSRVAGEQAAALGEEIEVLRGERERASTLAKKAEEHARTALDLRAQLNSRASDMERRSDHLEKALESERTAYAKAAERVEEMHQELGRVSEERDRIRAALESARFTDPGFGELLMRAVKNEVGSLPNSLDSGPRTAQLLEFMGKVLQAHNDLREPQSSALNNAHGDARSETRAHRSRSRTRTEKDDAEESDPSGAGRSAGRPASLTADVTTDLANGLKPEAQPKSRPTLSFRALGGAGAVGGSSHLLDFGSSRVLVDAGIKPDGRGPLAPDFKSLDALDGAVVTHAHLDHCGALPLLVRDRPGLPIYCTPPSARLIISALNDHSAMGGGLPGGAPIHEVGKRLVPVPFGKPFKIGGAKVTFTESGHILGAASVLLESGPATVFHTGDICMEDHFSIPSAQLPSVSDIDLLIMEATLADQKPQPFSESIRTMVEAINDTTLTRGGTALIPTYALGQAQEIILGLKHFGKEYGLDRDVFIYVDGSVVTTSERLYAEQLGYMKPYLQQTDPKELFSSGNIRAVANDDSARERILTSPCAIIASPVTMQGGASAFYRKRLEKSEKNAVILPSNAAASYSTNRVEGEEEEWRVERVNFAAHCTQGDLLDIAGKLTPRQIILIHGSKRRISDLAYQLAPNHKLHTPSVGETVRTVL